MSALVHTVVVLLFGTVVVFRTLTEPPDFAGEPGGFVGDENVTVAPPEDATMPQDNFVVASPSVSMATTDFTSITTTAITPTSFSMPAIATPSTAVRINTPTPAANSPSMSVGGALSKAAAGKIAGFTGGWAKGGTGMGQPLKSRQFEFTAYLARYREGDWDSTIWMDGDQIRGGSLHNLLFVIGKLSRDKLHAQPQPVPLDLSSDEIFKEKPPFILFTGHRDFRLTDEELVNLAEYLRSGGCIWGDSSLPGQRSRFDIAFRREMLRILPEGERAWRALPPTHPIFTAAYYQDVREVPPGMNYYREPIYALTGLAGEIAVIYTANDYGDMWQFGIDEKGQIDFSRDDKRRMVAVNEEMWHRRNLYFRNIEPKTLLESYKFGTNIIVHLLTRWESKVRYAPRGM